MAVRVHFSCAHLTSLSQREFGARATRSPVASANLSPPVARLCYFLRDFGPPFARHSFPPSLYLPTLRQPFATGRTRSRRRLEATLRWLELAIGQIKLPKGAFLSRWYYFPAANFLHSALHFCSVSQILPQVSDHLVHALSRSSTCRLDCLCNQTRY